MQTTQACYLILMLIQICTCLMSFETVTRLFTFHFFHLQCSKLRQSVCWILILLASQHQFSFYRIVFRHGIDTFNCFDLMYFWVCTKTAWITKCGKPNSKRDEKKALPKSTKKTHIIIDDDIINLTRLIMCWRIRSVCAHFLGGLC